MAQLSSQLSGPTKAAIIAATLGPEKAAEIITRSGLKPQHVERLALEMSRLDNIDKQTQQAVFQELSQTFLANEVQSGTDLAESLLKRMLGQEKATEVMGRIGSKRAHKPFATFSDIEPPQLLEILRDEPPYVIAIVLRFLPKKTAGEVLSGLPEELRIETVMRLVKAGFPAQETLRRIETALKRKLVGSSDASEAKFVEKSEDPARVLVEILNFADIAVEHSVLESLSQRDPELGEHVRESMFIFEDLPKIEARVLQVALREIDNNDLALALKGAADDIKNAVFENLSTNACDALKEELEALGRVRRSQVHEAQQKVVMTFRGMIDEGKINIRHEKAEAVEEEMLG